MSANAAFIPSSCFMVRDVLGAWDECRLDPKIKHVGRERYQNDKQSR